MIKGETLLNGRGRQVRQGREDGNEEIESGNRRKRGERRRYVRSKACRVRKGRSIRKRKWQEVHEKREKCKDEICMGKLRQDLGR